MRKAIRFAAVAIAAAALTTIPATSRAADRVPQFAEYRAGPTYMGPAKPIERSEFTRAYRTRLQQAAKERPNFAARFHLVTWGCGTSCVTGAVIDLSSGKVVPLPFSVCCNRSTDPAFNPVEVRPTSRLVVFSGLRNEEEPMGAHFYEFDGQAFRLIRTVEDDGSFGSKPAE